MKLHADQPNAANVIHAVTRQSVSINGQAFTTSVLVPSDAALQTWEPATVADLTASHFGQILEYKPELVVFGSGPVMKFVHPSLMRALMDARIGVDTMDTMAACRTYNILVSEGRRVLAALIIHP
jgi:uncharacterized protein